MTASPLTLRTRLGLAFASMLALTVAVGVFSLTRLAQVNDDARETDTRWAPALGAVNDLRTAGNRVRRTEADLVLASDVTQIAGIEKKLADFSADFRKKDQIYAAMASAGEEREGYDTYAKDRDRYFRAQERLLALARAGTSSQGEARAWYGGESRAAFDAMIVDLRVVAAFNEKGAKENVESVSRTYSHAIGWMIGFMAVASLLAASLGLWLARDLTRQLGAEPADASALAQRVAEGDLSRSIALRSGDAASMMAALKRMQDNLSRLVRQVRGGAEGVATASAQISQGTTDLSSRTEQQAAALEETSASMRELASTVKRNAQEAEHGNQLADRAAVIAARGGDVVGQVVDTMRGIQQASGRIADIIGVIDGIAFQTNILALNAAVEAARAGEQGRGFAVVAAEVRTLAQRSADAAKEIKDLITDSVGRVAVGSTLVGDAGTTMGEVVEAIREVSQIMSRISAASRQQSDGVDQVGEAVRQMDQTTQQNAALVEQSAAASDSLMKQAQQLVDAVAVFRVAPG